MLPFGQIFILALPRFVHPLSTHVPANMDKVIAVLGGGIAGLITRIGLQIYCWRQTNSRHREKPWMQVADAALTATFTAVLFSVMPLLGRCRELPGRLAVGRVSGTHVGKNLRVAWWAQVLCQHARHVLMVDNAPSMRKGDDLI